jgi:alanyl-tRNA synthetase
MARERGLAVDLEGWGKAEAEHQKKSRSEGSFKQILSAEQLAGLPRTKSTYHEAGSRSTELETRVAGSFGDRIVLEESPFYAESGGQVGDAGTIEAADGSFSFAVEDTKKLGDVVVHLGKARGTPKPGSAVRARVDRERRDRTRKNHTATHLMHRALKLVLGDHATQQGSYVGPDRLRFDFSHGKALSPEELERIETLVNERVFGNAPVKTTVEDLDAAKGRGVVAMFGEKYEERVRVLDVGGWSLELCGGTHVSAAGDIGPFLILSERAIQAGVRRIEALTGLAAVEEIQRQRRLLRDAAQSLKASPEEVPARLAALQKEVKEAKKKSAASSAGDVTSAFESLKSGLATVGGVSVGVVDAPGLDLAGIRDLADRGRSLGPRIALALFGRAEGRVPWVITLQGVEPGPGRDARELAKIASERLGGGGGGKSDLAQGQGQDPKGVPDAVREIESALKQGLAASKGPAR